MLECKKVCAAGIAGAIVLTAGIPATADVIEVLYTKAAGHPKAVVPGAKDQAGNPAVTEFKAMEDLIGSPDGTHWLLKARTQQGADLETMLMLGVGASGTIIAQEAQPVPGGESRQVYDFMGSGVGRFNENNDFAFTARTRGISPTRHVVIRSIGGVATLFLSEYDAYSGLVDNPPANSGDELVGNSVGSAHLLNDNTVGLQDPAIKNCHSTRRPALFYNNQMFHQRGVTTVTGLNGVGTEIVDGFTLNGFVSTPDFQPISVGRFGHWLARGNVDQQANDEVLMLDDAVVIQQGNAIPGTSVIADGIDYATLTANGDWYARGDTASGQMWAVRNGDLLAVTDDPVPGASERWGTSILAVGGNRNGDWFIVGSTDNADNTKDQVIVVNGEVVAREGDAVDLDGDGVPDADAFIGRSNAAQAAFEANDVFLSDDMVLYFLANLHDGKGNDWQSDPAFTGPTALLRMDLGGAAPCAGDLDDSGAVDVQDLLVLLAAWGPCNARGDCPADLNDSGAVDVQDLLVLLAAWGPCP